MNKNPKNKSKTALGRRAVLTAMGTGVAATALLKVSPVAQGKTYNPALIRPPGSLPENEFLTKCIRCGECMKVCPTNAIHPATLQGSLAGLWTPVVIPEIGYCEYNCTLCGQVCPTGAIRNLTVEERHPIKIGIAHVDRSRCLPWASNNECIVCEEHCPTPTKAIWLQEVTIPDRYGEPKVLKQPIVDPELCVGCGICENKCPVNDPSAIVVTSGGETRNPGNQYILSLSETRGRRERRQQRRRGQA
ncbi:MAG TPA: 4Fe-4S dicluster domain-containing protein [bacterium]|nr:4Fe-4S dicluster domain-containing protein [bacterium]HQL61789.1 4Fe-4S dicluster domain-containing protein [bacterium]